MFGLGLSSWNTIMVVFLGLAAFAALGLAASTRIVIVLQNRAEELAKNEFETYKLTVGVQVAEAKKEGLEQEKQPETRLCERLN